VKDESHQEDIFSKVDDVDLLPWLICMTN